MSDILFKLTFIALLVMPRKKQKITPVFNGEGIGLDEDLDLCVPHYASFSDVADFFDNEYKDFLYKNSGLKIHVVSGGYLGGFYLSEMSVSAGASVADEFRERIEEKSEETIFEFFTRFKLYDISSQSADEDLSIYFHTKFVH